jgi:hypothetical protein
VTELKFFVSWENAQHHSALQMDKNSKVKDQLNQQWPALGLLRYSPVMSFTPAGLPE